MEPMTNEHDTALAKRVSDKIAKDIENGLYKKPSEPTPSVGSDIWLDELLSRVEQEASDAKDASHVASSHSVSSLAPTAFPVPLFVSSKSQPDVLNDLTVLMNILKKSKDYRAIRDDYCRLSIELNLFGLLAPSSRPLLNTGLQKGAPVFHEIFRDQLVIDCHWLHSTKQNVTLNRKDLEFSPLFNHRSDFPFDLAWAFATNNWKKTHRAVGMLRLTPFQQFQLLAMQDTTVRASIDAIEKKQRSAAGAVPAPIDYFEQRLNMWCERDPRIIPHRAGYLAVWKARQLLGAAAPVSLICKLTGFMLGEPPKDHKVIRERERKILLHTLS